MRYELGQYSKKLLKKDEIIVFNKVDLIENEDLKKKKEKICKQIEKGYFVFVNF